jgi:hypothetical protein
MNLSPVIAKRCICGLVEVTSANPVGNRYTKLFFLEEELRTYLQSPRPASNCQICLNCHADPPNCGSVLSSWPPDCPFSVRLVMGLTFGGRLIFSLRVRVTVADDVRLLALVSSGQPPSRSPAVAQISERASKGPRGRLQILAEACVDYALSLLHGWPRSLIQSTY